MRKRWLGGLGARSRARAVASRRVVCGVVAVALLLALTSCSGSRSAARGTRVVVLEKDFSLHLSKAWVPAGTVTFAVENRGPSTHELNLDRTTDAAGSLPIKADGLTVNEDSSQLHRIDSVEVVRLDETKDMTVQLTPGHYVLYCNLEGHYFGGMHTTLDVTT
jgi:uncharacterized cupredoxin-like copper-binding protein